MFSLLALSAHGGDDKTCSATPKDCEHQIRQMLAGKRYLGIAVDDLNPGLIIKTVVAGSPALRAGLRQGDRIIAVNGHWTTNATVREFKQIMASARDNTRIAFLVQRGTTPRRIEVRPEPYTKEQIEKIVASHVAQSHPDAAPSPNP